jgi:hypothetical protein
VTRRVDDFHGDGIQTDLLAVLEEFLRYAGPIVKLFDHYITPELSVILNFNSISV